MRASIVDDQLVEDPFDVELIRSSSRGLCEHGEDIRYTTFVLPALAAVKALQEIDTAIDVARKRLAELPASEQAIAADLAAAASALEAATARVQENHHARRLLEKDVAAVDTRLSRFEDHKAAVKTNQEYQALTHEIATARIGKDGLEEKILILMEEADALVAEQKRDEAALTRAGREAEAARAALGAERGALELEIARLTDLRGHEAGRVDARTLGIYEQLLRTRRGLAVARMVNGHCLGCHVRLRPPVEQHVRRNDEIAQCESCQRILFYSPPAVAESHDPEQHAAGSGR